MNCQLIASVSLSPSPFSTSLTTVCHVMIESAAKPVLLKWVTPPWWSQNVGWWIVLLVILVCWFVMGLLVSVRRARTKRGGRGEKL